MVRRCTWPRVPSVCGEKKKIKRWPCLIGSRFIVVILQVCMKKHIRIHSSRMEGLEQYCEGVSKERCLDCKKKNIFSLPFVSWTLSPLLNWCTFLFFFTLVACAWVNECLHCELRSKEKITPFWSAGLVRSLQWQIQRGMTNSDQITGKIEVVVDDKGRKTTGRKRKNRQHPPLPDVAM